MNDKKYNLEKIKKLTSLDDVLKKDFLDIEKKKRFDLAVKRIELAHDITKGHLVISSGVTAEGDIP